MKDLRKRYINPISTGDLPEKIHLSLTIIIKSPLIGYYYSSIISKSNHIIIIHAPPTFAFDIFDILYIVLIAENVINLLETECRILLNYLLNDLSFASTDFP